MKRDLEEKERVMAHMALEPAILRKKWGFVGEIEGRWLAEKKKVAVPLIEKNDRSHSLISDLIY
jgi:hypothetical protein